MFPKDLLRRYFITTFMQEFKKLVEIVKILRSPSGCPWDRTQKLSDLEKYLLEETYELLDTLHMKDFEKTKEEIGDLFLILVFLVQIFEEKKRFNIKQVLEKINEKLVTRHPHVFGTKRLKNKEEVLNHWIKEKAKEKKRKKLSERLPKNAPSLLLGYLLFKELASLEGKSNPHKLVEEIERKIKKLKRKPTDKSLISEIVLKLSQLAACRGWDIENSLRKKILTYAKKIKY